MPDIDAEKIAELRSLLAKATLGPWSTHLVDDTTIMSPAREVATTCDSSQTDREDGYDIEYEQMEADAALIVAMRNAMPALLDLASLSLAPASGGEDAGDPQSIADARQIASEGEYTTDGGRSFAVEFDWVGIAQQGLENWKAKPHNARWFRKIDGTPIPNDLTICIGEAFSARIRSLSAQLAEARREGDLYRQQIGKAVARATAAESEAAALRERVGELTKAEERAVIAAITAVFPLEAMNIVGLSNMRLSDKMKDGVRAGIEAVRELRRARTALEGRE